jgi:redox-regulated HSP33 family molecular chaperone
MLIAFNKVQNLPFTDIFQGIISISISNIEPIFTEYIPWSKTILSRIFFPIIEKIVEKLSMKI